MSAGTSTDKRLLVTLPEASDTLVLPHIVTLHDAALRHRVTHVLRLRPGASLTLVDLAQSCVAQAELVSADEDALQVRLLHCQPFETEAAQGPRVTLGVALIKGNRWDWLLQKAAELGVARIVPLVTAYGVVQPVRTEAKRTRWHKTLAVAVEQSEGTVIPALSEPMSLVDFIADSAGCSTRWLLLERSQTPEPLPTLRDRAMTLPTKDEAGALPDIALSIGPEGGWTPEEVQQLTASGFEAVSLGPRILRSETAAIAALSLLLCV